MDGKDTGYTSVLDWFEKMGGTLKAPDDDPTREVVFANPRVHEDYKGLPAPIPDDYRAIPLTNMEVAAGPGLQTQEEPELKSWVLVYTQELALRSVRLVAARVGKNQYASAAPASRLPACSALPRVIFNPPSFFSPITGQKIFNIGLVFLQIKVDIR